MENVSEQGLPANRSSSPGMSQSGLDGVFLSPTILVLVSCSVIGSLLFTGTYVIEGITRPGYDAWQQAISALSLGPGGWVQQANFVLFGVLTFLSAFGWHQLLKPGAGSIWFPLFQSLTGLGLIVDGFFSQDPAPGYPPGAALTAPTLHGVLHVLFAFVTILALAGSCFVLARRFAAEPRWRGWATYSVMTGLLTILFITLFGVENAHVGPIAGLFERLSGGVHSLWSCLLLVLLLLKTRR